MQDDLRCVLGTKAGDIEVLKAIILYMLQRRESDEYNADRRVKWATMSWIEAAIVWYIKLRGLRIDVDIEQHFKFIMKDLVERGFIGYNEHPYKNRQTRDYYITGDGVNVSSASYLPILAESGIPKIISKDFDHLVHLSAGDIRKYILNYSS